ncbi:GDSL-type esterase/lipase family protein [Thalassobacillus sp. CUG 92003]|uniref:DUF459 domain-containing protein n=1 Tax=Thalassobacillus sp. CUG 92003 TaxID=2736641 RepID=UPI0015E6863D|nr:GDSL-type esterase/lipase family protein [Thalassobacillus sp. CUG 92003]
MKKFLLMISILGLLIAGLLTFIIIIQDTPSNQETDNTPQQEEPEETEQDTAEQNDEEADEEPEESTLGEVFTSVLENARGLFVQDDLDIVAIGDSLTQGVGDSTDNEGYVGVLEDSLNSNGNTPEEINIENYGKRGNRTDQLIERVKQEEMTRSIEQADLVLVTIGANDVIKVLKSNFEGLNYQDFVTAQEGYRERMDELVNLIRERNPNAPVYLIGLYNPFEAYFTNIPELGQITSDYNRITKEVISDQNGVNFIPIKDIFNNQNTDLLWKEDNFHPNEKGYKLIAERVLEYIRSDIEQNQ